MTDKYELTIQVEGEVRDADGNPVSNEEVTPDDRGSVKCESCE